MTTWAAGAYENLLAWRPRVEVAGSSERDATSLGESKALRRPVRYGARTTAAGVSPPGASRPGAAVRARDTTRDRPARVGSAAASSRGILRCPDPAHGLHRSTRRA